MSKEISIDEQYPPDGLFPLQITTGEHNGDLFLELMSDGRAPERRILIAGEQEERKNFMISCGHETYPEPGCCVCEEACKMHGLKVPTRDEIRWWLIMRGEAARAERLRVERGKHDDRHESKHRN